MKFVGAILVSSLVPLALIALAYHMMDIHQKGVGWVIAGVVICACSTIKTDEN